MNIIEILSALGSSGVTDILDKSLKQIDLLNKYKLKVLVLLIEKMDKNGNVNVREIVKDLLAQDTTNKLITFDEDEGGG